MRTGGALLIVAVGLLALWIVITGRLQNVKDAWDVITGDASATREGMGNLSNNADAGVTNSGLPSSTGRTPMRIPVITLTP